jgi:hypothetical protein
MPSILNIKKVKNTASLEIIRNCSVLANSRLEMLLKAIVQPLGIANRVQESCWEMSKVYWIGSGQFLEGIGKPLGNAQISPSAKGEKIKLPRSYWQICSNFHPFF